MDIELRNECKNIALRALCLDIAVYLVSSIFIGFHVSMLAGLSLGTVVMMLNMILLGKSVEAALMGSEKMARLKMVSSYMGRLLIIGGAFVLSLYVDAIHPVGMMIPIFYPKLIYTVSGIFNKKGVSK